MLSLSPEFLRAAKPLLGLAVVAFAAAAVGVGATSWAFGNPIAGIGAIGVGLTALGIGGRWLGFSTQQGHGAHAMCPCPD